MVNETYKLIVSLQVMKRQREELISNFTDNYDITMLEGLQRFDHRAEYNIYAELYHVMWIDKHWNQLQRIVESNVPLEEDRKYIEQYFSRCFLKFVEKFSTHKGIYTLTFYEILRVKQSTLRDLISIARKSDHHCKELAYDQTKHKKIYQEMLDKFLNKV